MVVGAGGVGHDDDAEAQLGVERLEGWLRSSTIQAGLAQRARIVLLAADGLPHVDIAARVGASRPTVTSWRARYERSGIGGLSDQARSGRPRIIDHREIVAPRCGDRLRSWA